MQKKKIILESLERTPACQQLSFIKYPVQPFTEFVYFCSNNFYDKIEDKTGLSIKDIYNAVISKSGKEKDAVIANFADMITARCPGTTWKYTQEFENNTCNQRIFVDLDIFFKGSTLCNIKLYTHMSFITPAKLGDRVYAACQFDFSTFDGFDFLELDRDTNIFDFSKDDECKETFDMIIACVQGLTHFTDFIKEYKVKTITVGNIQNFIDRLIAPIVNDVQALCTPYEFVIVAKCGEEFIKKKYSYEDYLNSVRDFANYIKEKYGERFTVTEPSDNSDESSEESS